MLTATPVWSAMPVQLMRFFNVRCSINSMIPCTVLRATKPRIGLEKENTKAKTRHFK